MLRIFLFLSTVISPAIGLRGQECLIQLSGHVEESSTAEKLIAATILIKETGKQVTTDKKGDFLIKGLCAGNYTLQ
jgi:hypothetical protein